MIFLDKNENRVAPLIVYDYERTSEINKPTKLKLEADKALEKNGRIIFDKEFIVTGSEEIKGRETDIELYAEESIVELKGKIIDDKRPNTLMDALLAITEGTRWEIGQYPTTAAHQLFFYRLDSYSALMETLKAYRLELDTEYRYTGREVQRIINLRTRLGQARGRRTTLATDATKIGRTILDDPVVTRLYGYGKGEELDSGGHGRRIDITSVNGGLPYIEDEQARLSYGIGKNKLHYEGVLIYSDITDPSELKAAMEADFEQLKMPKIAYEGAIEDLGIYNDYLGDDITILDEELDITVKGRILKLVEMRDGKEATVGNIIPSLYSETELIHEIDDRTKDLDIIRDIIADSGATDYLDGVIDRINRELNATSGFARLVPGRGLVVPNAPTEEEATQVIELGGGYWRIANAKDQSGNWIYRTIADGNGVIADEIVTGILKGGQVYFNLEAGTFLIGNPDNPNLYWDGENLSINGRDIDLSSNQSISLKVSSEVTEQLSDPAIREEFKGEPGAPGAPGAPGDDGRDVISLTAQYANSDSDTTPPTTGWGDSIPLQYFFDKYAIMVDVVVLAFPTTTTSTTDSVSVFPIDLYSGGSSAIGRTFGQLEVGELYLATTTAKTTFDGGGSTTVYIKREYGATPLRSAKTLNRATIRAARTIKAHFLETLVGGPSTYPQDGIQGDYWYTRGEVTLGILWRRFKTVYSTGDPTYTQPELVPDVKHLVDTVTKHSASIDVLSDSITQVVTKAEYVVDQDGVQKQFGKIQGQIDFTLKNWGVTFTEEKIDPVKAIAEGADAATKEVSKYMRFTKDGELILGSTDSPWLTTHTQQGWVISESGQAVAGVAESRMFMKDAEIQHTLQINAFRFTARSNGNVSFG